ncbi:MAG: hypothetical protein AAGJ37_01565 [Pseudomonadota bacterium]
MKTRLSIKKPTTPVDNKRIWLFSLLSLVAGYCYAEQPTSNIYLGQVDRSDNGIKVVDVVAVTDNPEYTNQPYFFDEGTLYYTQEIKENDASQTDIFKYDIAEKSSSNVTQSIESEYSPTPMMDGTGFSVIRVNGDDKQELWKIGFDGQTKMHLVPAIEPVGYHAWTREDKLLLFVLGEPHELVLADPARPDEEGLQIATNIGASIFEMPLTLGHTYTIEDEKGAAPLFWFDPYSNSTVNIGSLPNNAKYYAWSSRAELFTTDNNKLVTMPFIVNGQEIIYTAYSKVQVDSPHCQSGISRIALSPYNDKIALVCHQK